MKKVDNQRKEKEILATFYKTILVETTRIRQDERDSERDSVCVTDRDRKKKNL